MTSTSTLPSVGPPPPNLRRPNVPEDLKPKIADRAEELSRRPRSRVQPEAEPAPKPKPVVPEFAPSKAGPGKQPQGNNSAVALQVLEGREAVEVSPRTPAPSESAPVEPPSIEDLPPEPRDLKLSGELSDEEKAYVRQLKARDREVRAHETAHATAGSGYTSRPNFEFTTGPDGVQYAVGGHVSIDTSTVPDDPEATIAKMEVVRRAALAPARPSGQDRAVAAAAEQALRVAQAELQEQRAAEREGQLDGINGEAARLEALAISASGPDAGAETVPSGTPSFGLGASRPEVRQPIAISIDLIA